MAYKRGLRLEGRRLLSKRWEDVWLDEQMWGYHCLCCNPPGEPWRFLQGAGPFDVRRLKFRYLRKRYPKMMKLLADQEYKRYLRTGREDDAAWCQEMVRRYAP